MSIQIQRGSTASTEVRSLTHSSEWLLLQLKNRGPDHFTIPRQIMNTDRYNNNNLVYSVAPIILYYYDESIVNTVNTIGLGDKEYGDGTRFVTQPTTTTTTTTTTTGPWNLVEDFDITDDGVYELDLSNLSDSARRAGYKVGVEAYTYPNDMAINENGNIFISSSTGRGGRYPRKVFYHEIDSSNNISRTALSEFSPVRNGRALEGSDIVSIEREIVAFFDTYEVTKGSYTYNLNKIVFKKKVDGSFTDYGELKINDKVLLDAGYISQSDIDDQHQRYLIMRQMIKMMKLSGDGNTIIIALGNISQYTNAVYNAKAADRKYAGGGTSSPGNVGGSILQKDYNERNGFFPIPATGGGGNYGNDDGSVTIVYKHSNVLGGGHSWNQSGDLIKPSNLPYSRLQIGFTYFDDFKCVQIVGY